MQIICMAFSRDLSLSIPAKSRSVSLYNCFDMFVQEEVLDGDEMPV